MTALYYISLAIGIVGVSIIVWGVFRVTLMTIRAELKLCPTPTECMKRETLRLQLGYYLLLGLEFPIAADIIKTIKNPELKEMAVLGSIVAIRTVISFFLNRELQDDRIREAAHQ